MIEKLVWIRWSADTGVCPISLASELVYYFANDS